MNINQNHDLKLDIISKLISSEKPNISKISNTLDITRQTLINNIENLRIKKIIKDFTININPNINPNLKYVLLEIKTNPSEPDLIHSLKEIKQLKMLDGILGEFSIFALFIFHNYEEFNQTLKKIDNIMAKSYFKKYQIIEPIKVYKTHGIQLSKFPTASIKLDATDFKILEILQYEQAENLLSTYDISKKDSFNIDKSQSTVYNRIEAMKKANIILNYAVNFDPRLLKFEGKFILRIKPKNPSHYDDLASNLEKKDEIKYLFRIGEQFGLLAIVRMKRVQDYGKFIKNLYESEEIEDTFTNFVLDEQIKYTNFVIKDINENEND